ncbi:TetR/AcrR family transcriptional regulator [Mycobacterium sp. 21AC1]|uniref:TetR/AcrR family transcriptional regulator n=1 Tax=[Mycobacterium] appelbergii TaxID=2939269 RepID=UPI002938EE87|nr:TetR/AcrR family transcriptional regulator [Mycobacterium sp. 21AC1]MDV3123576.1 TetR/AcrR family transcriptional regulator [Mycobacterium sp. 21AC1]
MTEPQAIAGPSPEPATSTRVSRRRDRRKAEIVRTATKLLSEHGYQGMNLEDVAEQTDIAKATLYHYFSSKDELVAVIIETLTVGINERLEIQLDTVRDHGFSDQLRALIREQVLILTVERPEVAMVFSWPRTWPAAFEEVIKQSRRRHDAIFRGVVEAGVTAGEFDCPNIDVALQCLHGVLNQSSLWIRPSLPADRSAELRELVVETALRMFTS